MSPNAERVAELIRQAFAGVTLGNGVGLNQAQGLDDYADSDTLAELRSRDELLDWTRLAPAELDRCYSSPSFFDPEGMRFHLPAYLLAELEGDLCSASIVFHLTYDPSGPDSRFALLNGPQREAVREFLWLHLTERDCEFDRPLIEESLLYHWGVPARFLDDTSE